MQLKLKEDPREWQKFAWLCCGIILGGLSLLRWRGTVAIPMFVASVVTLALLALVIWIQPRWFRSFYRAAMTISFHVGQIMGKVLLTLVYLGIVTPLGLALRLSGKKLLPLERRADQKSYWKKARPAGKLEQQF